MDMLSTLHARGIVVLEKAVHESWLVNVKSALEAADMLNVNGRAAATMPDSLELLYRTVLEPLVTETLGAPMPMNEWQSSTIVRGFEGDAFPHIDGQGYIGRGGTWNRLPGFQVLVAVPLADAVSTARRGGLMGIVNGHEAVREFFLKHASKYFHADGSCKLEEAKACSRHLTGWLHDARIESGTESLYGKPGSVTIATSLMPHYVEANDAEDRTVVYFRLGTHSKTGLPALIKQRQF